jgi:hypothetical protein
LSCDQGSDALCVFQTVKVAPKLSESRVVQALIRFGHRANMQSFKLF